MVNFKRSNNNGDHPVASFLRVPMFPVHVPAHEQSSCI